MKHTINKWLVLGAVLLSLASCDLPTPVEVWPEYINEEMISLGWSYQGVRLADGTEVIEISLNGIGIIQKRTAGCRGICETWLVPNETIEPIRKQFETDLNTSKERANDKLLKKLDIEPKPTVPEPVSAPIRKGHTI